MAYQQPYGQDSQYQADQAAAQMSNLNLGDGTGSVRGGKRRARHAYHDLNQSAPPAPAPGFPPSASPGQPSMAQFVAGTPGFGQSQFQQQQPGNQQMSQGPPSAPAQAIATSAQGRVDPDQIPSIPFSRDTPAQWYLEHIYPTMEQHLPPPASIPFVSIDQGNATPKFARLTMNSIPHSSEGLNSTSIPLGLIIQPLAPRQDGEQDIPLVDFGEAGPPRCRRCRAYINPFMSFRSGGNKFICNMCTFPNDVAPDYFAPVDQTGARVDRMQRPELSLGTVDFAAPKEYCTKDPVPIRVLFMLDVSMESVTRGYLEAICEGILSTLYGPADQRDNEDEPYVAGLPAGARIGIVTFDKAIHYYDLHASRETAGMHVMSDLEEPFLPLGGDGLFVDPVESKKPITSLLSSLPDMFRKFKSPEPALFPALKTALEALQATGGKIICSLASLPTWGPARLFLRERPEMRDTDAERKLFAPESAEYIKLARDLTEAGIGIDFFLASPQGGYLDLATIGHLSEKTGGEVYYYPNFHSPRDNFRISKEIKRVMTRETGFQGLMKVRCSNGLQVSAYYGNFTQHTFGADLEFGTIDADKAFGVLFGYDGKLDPKLDAHFQCALLYTTASGQRRIRCSNIVASVTEGANESMKYVDQDAVVTLLAKQAAMRMPDKMLKDVRAQLTEKTIDILASYRKNFSGSHPPGQLVLPEHLKEFHMYMLGLLKSRALKAGHEPTDRRVHDMRLVRSMSALETSLYLYPRVIGIHNLEEHAGFANENGHLIMPPSIRASYSRMDEGGVYIVDSGQMVLLWFHANVSPNLLEDLYGPGYSGLKQLNAFSAEIPVLDTHLNAQVRNILQFLEDNRGSKAMTIQLARQGMDGAEYEFARLLYEDRNNEAQSCVDWLVHVHRHIQLELQGQRRKDEGEGALASLTGMKAPYWT